MKKIKYLLLGIVGILGIGFSNAFTYSGFTYEDGVYYKPSLGLITVIDGTGAWTLQDKNLGATQVYNYGDILSFNNVGYLFQYGNNYGFNFFEGGFETTNSMPDISNYSPSSYSSSVFVDNMNWIPMIYNSNIWGMQTQTLEDIKGPCPDGFHLPENLGFDITHFASNYIEAQYLLKFPLGGFGYTSYDGLLQLGYEGDFFLNSSYDGNNPYSFRVYHFPSGVEDFGVSTWGQSYVTSVRCYRDIGLLPNNTWISLTGGDVSLLPGPEEDNSGDDEIYSVGTEYYNFNKALIESAVWCYITSGLYMDGNFINGDTGCDALNYVDFIESLDVDISSRYFDNVSKYGNLKFNDSSKVLYYYCLSDSLSYPFCNDLDFYSSTYLIYSIVAQGSGPSRLMYNIYGSGVNVAIENNGTGYFGNTTCNGIWCSEVSTGSPTYIETSYNEYTGYNFEYLPSPSSFNVEAGSGFFFNCPYPYTKVFINMDNKIVDYLAGTKLGRVINCPISAFRYGYRTLIFGDLNGTGYYWDGHLFNGNTPGHRALFMFFDILLSLIIIFILIKFYKLLSK